MSGDALGKLHQAMERLVLPVQSRRDLRRLEFILDEITSALQPFWDFPIHLQDGSTLFDEVMAYLSSRGDVSLLAAEAASHLQWGAGISVYEWATTGNVLEDVEQSRSDIYKELKTLYERLQKEAKGG